MTMPFYVAPEQFMKDKADFARKNVARGRPLVAVIYDGGILLAAENPSHTLRKISEIYDRIAFAGVGKYNEFDALRQAGVRYADVEGFRYSREDVHANALANAYAQIVGNTFTHDVKPMEVEILVAEVGTTPDDDELYHILYDGVVVDETGYAVLGGETDAIDARMKESFVEGFSLAAAVRAAVTALAGPERTLAAADLEAAVLERDAARRAFRRLENGELAELLQSTAPAEATAPGADPTDATAATEVTDATAGGESGDGATSSEPAG
ncbi:MAG TPA: proteasome subunit alpha [Acidimicrobiales bacterium]|nr:proteasome subunit alpha [Acidimicrobiales bacterium]